MGAPKDDSAERARKAEEERKARIAEGTEAINETFAQFDDPYYMRQGEYYSDFYQPELQDQYQDAYQATVHDLNRRRMLNSSAGAQALGRLQERLAKETSQISGRAEDYQLGRRSAVEQSRRTLMDQLNATADPAAARTAALSEAEMLSQQQTLSPLGAVFADLVSNLGQGVAAERAGYRGLNTGIFRQNPGRASRVVS